MSAALLTHHGLVVGQVRLVLHVRLCRGYVRHLDGGLQKEYAASEATYPLQARGSCPCLCVRVLRQ
jgi:hypothetical protein